LRPGPIYSLPNYKTLFIFLYKKSYWYFLLSCLGPWIESAIKKISKGITMCTEPNSMHPIIDVIRQDQREEEIEILKAC